jgi:hypothetical protein
MFDQTTINRLQDLNWNSRVEDDREFKKPDSHHGVRHLLADISELVELQTRLTTNDLKSSLARLIAPMSLLVVAAVVLLGTIPVLLLAIASALVIELQWSSYAAQFASGGLAILTAIMLVLVAILKLKRVAAPMERSVSELGKNIETIRDLLRDNSHPEHGFPKYPR